MVKKLKEKIIKAKLFQIKATKLFFALLGLFALSFVSYFLYFQISGAKDADEILPAEGLLAYSEFSQNDFAEFIQKNKTFRENFLDPFFQQYLNQNLAEFNLKAKDWLGNKSAFAVYENTQNPLDKTYYLFLENDNQKKAIRFLQELGIENEKLIVEEYKKSNILSFSQSLGVDCTFLYGYLICSNEVSALKKLIDFNQNQIGFLAEQENYNRVKNNLPKVDGGKVFVNLAKVDFHNYEFYLGPLKEYLQEAGIAFSEINQGIRLNSYLALKKGLTQTGTTVLKNDLAKYIVADDLAIFMSGANLTQSFQQILTVWDEITPYFAIIIEGMVRARVVDYFGESVSLEEDLYPLLKNNYALGIKIDEKTFLPEAKLILEVDDLEKAEVVLDKMLHGFYLKNKKMMATKKETTLKDGSVVKELIADSTKVQKVKTDFKGITINSIDLGGENFSFAYATYKDKIFLAINPNSLKENLDLIKNPEKSLSQDQIYLNAKKNMFLEGEEISFFNFKKINQFINLLLLENQQTSLLSVFDFAIISTKWFDDGMANEVILLNSKF